jgi:hypothetical protein
MAKKRQQKPNPSPTPTNSAPQENPRFPDVPGQKQLIRISFDPIFKNIHLKTNRELLHNIISKRNNTNLITLVLKDGTQLKPNIILPMFEVLKSIGKQECLDIFLLTTGGATEVPWRIVTLLREFCNQLTAIIPFGALSAGTHIALGANNLIMSEISTLGPVDPTTLHPLLPRDKNDNPIPVSVEDLKNCIKFISQQLQDQNKEEKYSPSDMTNIVGKLFEHIEPLAIGAVERAYGLSRLITKKVLETHLDPVEEKDKIERIVNKIGGEYFSHAFPITVRDVEKDFQLSVQRPDSALFNSIWELYEYYKKAFDQEVNVNMTLEEANGRKKNVSFILVILGFIDSVLERRILIQLKGLKEDKKGGGGIIQEPVFTGWVKPHTEELPSDSANIVEIKG